MSKLKWLAALLMSIALILFAFLSRPALGPSQEDAEARRIVDACAIGESEAGRARLAIGLSKRLRDLTADGAVTSERVGAILDKIMPNAAGRDTYALYIQCLKQQTELSLRARGVRFDTTVAPSDSTITAPAPAESVAGGRSRTTATEKYKTDGDCSSIIVGSDIGTFSQHCEEQ